MPRDFAAKAHEGQKYAGEPYTVHLDAVVAILREFKVNDPDVIAAGFLHDVIEDTAATKEDLVEHFGQRVADLVDAVTDGEGKNRAERKERPYRLIPTVPGALTVKLADRAANIISCLESNPGLLKMYRKEHLTFAIRLTPYARQVELLMLEYIDILLLELKEG